MKNSIGLFLSLILFFSILPAFADEGYFENYNRQLYRQPTVCIFEPDDITLPDTTWKYWYSESMKGIDEWENRLKNTSSKNWDINVVEVTKEKLKFLNSSGCDINIRFLDSSYFGADANSFNGWYSPYTKSIEIIRNQMTYCGKYLWEPYGIFLDKYCRGDDLERGKKMAATVKHEFGHAFGLGHFVSDNRELMQSWYTNPLGAPSIMTAAPSNEDVRQITQIDVERVLEIHGILGFGKEKNTEPVFIYPEKIITEPTVSNIQTIQVKPYQTSSIKITGYIPEEIYSRGTPVEFQVTKPDGTKESFATRVNSHQYFEYPMIFDSKFPSGTYEILVIYKGEFIQKNAVNLSKSATSTNSQKTTIPNSNSASGTYLTKISITSDNNEYHVKSYLGKTSSPTSSIRITAENECPMKKQVFQKDFLFRTGNEVSFSFYQISQGKPSQCTIYFSITDFNGKKLDSIKTSYELQPTNKQNLSINQVTKPETSASRPIFTEQQKQVLTAQIDSTSISLLKLKESMDTTWGHMMDARKNYKTTQAQEHIDKAWDVYNGLYSKRNNLGKNLDGIVTDFLKSKNSVSSYNNSNFNDYINKLNNIKSQITKIESDTKYISQELDYAKKAEDERTSTSKSTKSDSQCFLFWC